MNQKTFVTGDKLAGFILGTALLAALTGCVTDGSYQSNGYQRPGYQARPTARVQATVAVEDDYDYYPGYETYYSRNRNEYVYRDGNAWVRRPAPPGVAVNVLFASPSVRLDFHDSPELHHSTVVRSYPRNWAPPGKGQDDKGERKNDRKPDERNG